MTTDLDPTIYNQLNKPASPIETLGQYTGVANALQQNQLLQQQVPIAQQHLQQAQIDTEKAQGLQHVARLVGQFTGENGKLDALAFKHACAKDPIAARNFDVCSAIADPMLEEEQFGVRPDGTPNMMAKGQAQVERDAKSHPQGAGQPVTTVVPQGEPQGQGNEAPAKPVQLEGAEEPAPKATGTGAPGYAGDVAPGFTNPLPKSRENYNSVVDEASKAPGQNAAYNEVINLGKQGVMSGTNLTSAYAAAARNDPFHLLTGATDETVKNQELQKWLSQGLLANGMPGSDSRLAELQHGNLNPEQLSETLKEMAPFFKAVSEGAVKKQNYYNKVTDNGTNLNTEPHANEQWNNHYDPRWIEFDDLPDKKSQRAFLAKHPDLIEKQDHHKMLQNMGVVSKIKDK